MELASLILTLLNIKVPKLSKDNVYKIKNNIYTKDEMINLKVYVIDTYKKSSIGFNRALLSCVFIFAFIIFTSLYHYIGEGLKENNYLFIFSLIPCFSIFIVLFIFKIVYVNKIKKQYNKLVQLYYREYFEELYID